MDFGSHLYLLRTVIETCPRAYREIHRLSRAAHALASRCIAVCDISDYSRYIFRGLSRLEAERHAAHIWWIAKCRRKNYRYEQLRLVISTYTSVYVAPVYISAYAWGSKGIIIISTDGANIVEVDTGNRPRVSFYVTEAGPCLGFAAEALVLYYRHGLTVTKNGDEKFISKRDIRDVKFTERNLQYNVDRLKIV